LSRIAAFSAADIQMLFRIKRASRLALILFLSQPKNLSIRSVLIRLRFLQHQMCAPMVMYRTVLQPKNRTIQSLEWSDDFIRDVVGCPANANLRQKKEAMHTQSSS
jgi:hypothetical protein